MSDPTADFNAPTVPPDDDPSRTPPTGAAEFQDAEKYVGRTVGGVKLDRLLGAGGMGAVFVGEHQRLGKQVAIKILPKGLARESERAERFLREARAAAKLEHPNIVTVFDVGEETDVWFISMRFVEGESAAGAVRRQGPLPVRRVLHIIRGVSSALEAAHKRSIVHRDVKPENVLLGEDDEVLLADFGLVRDLESNTQLSQSGQILGTPAYMSPEQARGEKVDHRSDIYSLGTTAYYLATGLPPFQAETAIATALKHIMDDAVPPSEEVPGIPQAFDGFIAHLMAKQPDDRPPSAGAVVSEIDRLLAGGLDEAPPTAISRTGLYAAAGGVFGLILLVALGAAMSGGGKDPKGAKKSRKKAPAKVEKTPKQSSQKPSTKPATKPAPAFPDPAATERKLDELFAAKRYDDALALAAQIMRAPDVPESLIAAAERTHIASRQKKDEKPLLNSLYRRVAAFRTAITATGSSDAIASFAPPSAGTLEVELAKALVRLTPDAIAWSGAPNFGPITSDSQGRRTAVVGLPFRRLGRPEAGNVEWYLGFVLINDEWYPRFGGTEHTIKPAIALMLDRMLTAQPRSRRRILEAEVDASLQARGMKPGSNDYRRRQLLMVRGIGFLLGVIDRAEQFDYGVQEVAFDPATRVATAKVHFASQLPGKPLKESDSTFEFKLVSGRWLWWTTPDAERGAPGGGGKTGKPGKTGKNGEEGDGRKPKWGGRKRDPSKRDGDRRDPKRPGKGKDK